MSENDVNNSSVLEKPIQACEFNQRAKTIFKHNGICTLGDLTYTTRERLFEMRNFGMETFIHVVDVMRKYNIRFRDENKDIAKDWRTINITNPDCGLSRRVKNALMKQGIYTLGDLKRRTEAEVQSFEGIGIKAFGDIVAMMTKYGVFFKTDEEEKTEAEREAVRNEKENEKADVEADMQKILKELIAERARLMKKLEEIEKDEADMKKAVDKLLKERAELKKELEESYKGIDKQIALY